MQLSCLRNTIDYSIHVCRFDMGSIISGSCGDDRYDRRGKSSAIIYSIVETAKANNLKPYDYFKCLLIEIPK